MLTCAGYLTVLNSRSLYFVSGRLTDYANWDGTENFQVDYDLFNW